MLLMEKLGARCVNNLHKINTFYVKIMTPPCLDFSLQMVANMYTISVSSESSVLLSKAKHFH